VASDPGREPATHAIKAEKKPLAADRMRESLAAMKADRRWTFGHNSWNTSAIARIALFPSGG
jgi:hypothetical protein